MEQLYYDREGCPVSRTQWQQLGYLPGYSRIARTDIIRYGRRINVATRWIGIADGTAVARIFQTDGEVRRRGATRPSYRRQWEWATLEAARTGHQEIADWLARVATWLAGVTDQMPSPPQVPSASEHVPLAAEASQGNGDDRS